MLEAGLPENRLYVIPNNKFHISEQERHHRITQAITTAI